MDIQLVGLVRLHGSLCAPIVNDGPSLAQGHKVVIAGCPEIAIFQPTLAQNGKSSSMGCHTGGNQQYPKIEASTPAIDYRVHIEETKSELPIPPTRNKNGRWREEGYK